MVTQYYFHGFTLSESKNYIIIPQLITNLNDYVDGIDIRYNSSNLKPEWSIRGADTFVPFKSNQYILLSGATSAVIDESISNGIGAYSPVGAASPYDEFVDGEVVTWSNSVGGQTFFRTKNKVDITDIGYALLTYAVTGNTPADFGFYIYDGTTVTYFVNTKSNTSAGIDLTAYSGEYYLGFMIKATASSTPVVTKVDKFILFSE